MLLRVCLARCVFFHRKEYVGYSRWQLVLIRAFLSFCGWAEEFEMASLARKRVILSQLFERVEVGRGYEVTVHVNMSYQQFVNMGEPNEKMKLTQASATSEEVA